MADLTNPVSAWPANVGVPPDGDPKAIIFPGLLFPVAGVPGAQRLKLSEETQRNLITNIQSVWIDNDTDARVTVEVAIGTKHRVIAKARTQGWYPILMMDDWEIIITASAVIADPNALRIGFANVNLIVGPYGI